MRGRGGETASVASAAGGYGLSALRDRAEGVMFGEDTTVTSDDEDGGWGRVPHAIQVRRELARHGGLVVGTAGERQVLVVGCSPMCIGQVLAFSEPHDEPVTGVDAVVVRLEAGPRTGGLGSPSAIPQDSYAWCVTALTGCGTASWTI